MNYFMNNYCLIVIIIDPTMANSKIIDVIKSHIGYTVYITLPILVICDVSAIAPSHT